MKTNDIHRLAELYSEIREILIEAHDLIKLEGKQSVIYKQAQQWIEPMTTAIGDPNVISVGTFAYTVSAVGWDFEKEDIDDGEEEEEEEDNDL